MNNNGPKILGPDGQPISKQPPIVVVKSRHPLPPQLIQNIGMSTKCSVIVLPLEIDLMTGKLAMEEIEAIHGAIHDILEIEEEKK
ncbi:hypothetical protein ES703_69781 [subsurface metagenome]